MSSRKSKKTTQSKQSSQKWVLWAALGGLILLIALVFAFNQPGQVATAAEGTLPAEISVAQAAELRESGAYILDVRTVPEWEDLHIPDTNLIPLDELSARMDEVPQDEEVVIICRSGNRSAQARDLLKAAGYTNVTSVSGGMNQWAGAGYPTTSGQ